MYDPETISSYWGRRPVSVVKRIAQLAGISGTFMSSLFIDLLRGRLKETEVSRAIQLRDIVTSLGPAYIKLGQALSIRPDILSPAAMNELQKLCDKVPSFDSKLAMQVSSSAAQYCATHRSQSKQCSRPQQEVGNALQRLLLPPH